MDFSSLVAPRLVEERKRLSLNQEQAGDACNVSREMWGKYERGKAAMGTEVLAHFGMAGADTQYILTGNRQGQGIGESAVYQAVLDAVDLLSLEKKVDAQQLARAVVKLCAKSASAPPTQPTGGTPQARQVFNAQVGSSVNVEGNLKQTGISFFGDRKNNK